MQVVTGVDVFVSGEIPQVIDTLICPLFRAFFFHRGPRSAAPKPNPVRLCSPGAGIFTSPPANPLSLSPRPSPARVRDRNLTALNPPQTSSWLN